MGGMILQVNSKISLHQLYFLIVITQIGVGVLSLPNSVFLIAKNDSWISVILAGFIVQIILIIIWKVDQLTKGKDLLEITNQLFGKGLGKFFQVIYLCYFLSVGTIILILYNEVLKTWVFTHTPKHLIIGLFVIVSIYLVVSGLNVIASFFVLVSILIIVLLISVSVALKESHIFYLFPIGINGFINIFKGTKECFLAMLGFELCFLFLARTKASNKEKLTVITIANITVTFIYTFITFVSILFYSPDELKLVPEPVLYMMKEYTFIVLERVDLIFLSVYIVVVVTTYSSYLFAASNALKHIISNHTKYTTYGAGCITFIFAILPKTHLQIEEITKYIGFSSIGFILIVPSLMLILIIFFWKRVGNNDEDSN